MVVTALATGVLAIIIGNITLRVDARPTRRSSSTPPALVKGDDIRIAGVKVGTVKGISIVDRTRALVTFAVAERHRAHPVDARRRSATATWSASATSR